MMKITWALLMLSAAQAFADNITPALRLTYSVHSNTNAAENFSYQPFCSASLVNFNNQKYLATARHCFFSSDAKEAFKSMPDSSSITLQNFNGAFSNFFDLGGALVAFDNGEQGDGLLLSSNTMSQLDTAAVNLSLASPEQYESESKAVRISGFRRQHLREYANCQRINRKEFKKLVPFKCRTITTLPDDRKDGPQNLMTYRCPIENHTPNGVSGGPVFSEQGNLIGVVSFALAEPPAELQSHPLVAQCFSILKQIVWVSGLNPADLQKPKSSSLL